MEDKKNFTEQEEQPPVIEQDVVPAEEPDGEQNELEALRDEVARLKVELEEKTALAETVTAQLEEFAEVFPNTDIKTVPDSVWDSVRSGNSLAAAYALYAKKTEARERQIRAVNEQNARQSAGKLTGGATSEYFTPAEVRAMSQSDVRANYSKIIESMKKWN